MVRLVAFLFRNPELSHEEFVEHWRNHHGPLIAGTPELARHVVRYEQHPRHLADDGLTSNEDADGVAMQWMNSLDDFVAFISEPAYREKVAPDERQFLDMARVRYVICEEPNVVIDQLRGDGPVGRTEGR